MKRDRNIHTIVEGVHYWRNQKNELHRLDGPAVIHIAEGWMEWYVNNKLHREDGPAHIHPRFFKSWYKHGKLHRLDGPSIVDKSGSTTYYLNGNIIVDPYIIGIMDGNPENLIYLKLKYE